MRANPFRFWLASILVLACCVSLQAQQTGGGGATGGGATGGGATGGGATGGGGGATVSAVGGGSTGGGSTIGAPSASGAGGAMTADQAFSNVQRGDAVGSTGATGSGFSSLSVAGGGGGGIGGLGGVRGLGGGGLGGLGGLSSLFGGLSTQGQATKPAIRTRLRSAVLYEPHPPERVQQRVNTQFRSLTQPQLQGVTITMEGRRGVLTGVVESERHRRMSEMLLRLEPGVGEVDNQLQVASP